MKKLLLITASLLPASLALSSPGITGVKAEFKTEEWRTYGPMSSTGLASPVPPKRAGKVHVLCQAVDQWI